MFFIPLSVYSVEQLTLCSKTQFFDISKARIEKHNDLQIHDNIYIYLTSLKEG